jgi:hypothetical protein
MLIQARRDSRIANEPVDAFQARASVENRPRTADTSQDRTCRRLVGQSDPSPSLGTNGSLLSGMLSSVIYLDISVP